MFRAKTVLVIGAGASVEVGLPVGEGLLNKIAELTHIKFDPYRQTSGDHVIVDALKGILNEGRDVKLLNEHLHAAWQLGESAKQALSIDNVIDALEDSRIELVGKLGIVRAILLAESSSHYFRHLNNDLGKIDISKFSETWYSSFTKILTENKKKSEIKDIFSNIEIINFNYDRCLEHYLPFSLSSYYGVDQGVIREAMQSLIIHRPYGVSGRLPWQAGAAPAVAFGAGNADQLAEAAKQIRTFTERIEEGTQLKAMRTAIANADRIVFLGFAFHRQNVELLAQQVQTHAEIVATTFKISKSDKAIIRSELDKAFDIHDLLNEQRVELADMTCQQFFKEYWRTLTAEKSDREPFQPQELLGNLRLP